MYIHIKIRFRLSEGSLGIDIIQTCTKWSETEFACWILDRCSSKFNAHLSDLKNAQKNNKMSDGNDK